MKRKTCRACRTRKPQSEFDANPDTGKKRRTCRACYNPEPNWSVQTIAKKASVRRRMAAVRALRQATMNRIQVQKGADNG